MKYLEFDVKNMAISQSAEDKTKLISGAVNYFGLHFNFDEEFATIPGTKTVEFIKKNNKECKDLIDGKCEIPNWILADKDSFLIRVTCGTTIGTQWQQVGITESGIIMPEEPEEEAPPAIEYVKTASGENAAPYLRAASNGLEFSKDGETWEGGVSGVPEVPRKPNGGKYVRVYGDWVLQEESDGISAVKVDGIALTPTDGAVDIDLSAYAKTTDIADEYATKTDVADLKTLKGTAETISELDYSADDISAVVTAFNGLVTALKARGVIL